MMLSRLSIGAFAIAAVVAVAGQSTPPARAAGATVTIANFSFTDSVSGTSTTTINVGDTVTWAWANTASVPHSTTSTSVPAGAATWDSGAHPSPFSFGPVTFTVAGTYTYHCIVHPSQMTGTIVVQAAAAPVPATSTPVAATNTPPAAISTSVAQATSTTAAVASPSPVLIAPAPTMPPGGAAGAATQTLPRTGTGTSSSGAVRRAWPIAALAALGAGAIASGAAVSVVHRRRGG